MASWDVFHSDRLELARGLSSEEVRAGVASGAIRDDDLARPSGTTAAWVRVAEVPELIAPPNPSPAPAPAAVPSPPPPAEPDDYEVLAEDPEPPPAAVEEDFEEVDLSFPVLDDEPARPVPAPPAWAWDDDDEDEDEEAAEELEVEEDDEPEPEDEPDEPPAPAVREAAVASWEPTEDDLDFDRGGSGGASGSRVALPTVRSRDYDDRGGGELDDEDDEDGGVVSLTRSGPPRVEELDLAAMVDVAFQLVLFFLVTATTILYKTLEIPKPSAEAPPEAVAQGRNRTIEDLKEDYILVEIDPEGNIQIDREPVAARMADLAERLRTAREKTSRTTMLLSADFATPHRSAVLAYDAANEIGLGIAIAKPLPPQGPPPALRPAPAAAKKAGA
ncbi:biopolymer transporter ExbD [Paludisphaera mucosa]|uniref:Biopolymer transporter ExbD n=1 Tax=Paludisphaera mucosa TaxID=3030827 RepID=A0ABT6FK59_9BACT|nr:biopolymer transporter ExbD [Paludisphaera mucosa]MDG3007966.1 biopolymer transporter ExbD [Paludisphaera mucosa]